MQPPVSCIRVSLSNADVLKSRSRDIAAAINANPVILDTESVAAVVKLALKTPGYYNEHEALNKALKTHGVNSVTDAAFEGVEIQGSTLIACAKFITSKTATIYAEQGVKAGKGLGINSNNALKEHARDIAAAINANPAILDQNSVAAVVNLALKTPGYYNEHENLQRILSTYEESQRQAQFRPSSGPQFS